MIYKRIHTEFHGFRWKINSFMTNIKRVSLCRYPTYFSFGRLPLDGSHEPHVVMTKEKVRESHRVALLMPKGIVFRTPKITKVWLTLLRRHTATRHYRRVKIRNEIKVIANICFMVDLC